MNRLERRVQTAWRNKDKQYIKDYTAHKLELANCQERARMQAQTVIIVDFTQPH